MVEDKIENSNVKYLTKPPPDPRQQTIFLVSLGSGSLRRASGFFLFTSL